MLFLVFRWAGTQKESAYDIYISNLQSLISFDVYLFICKKEFKSNREAQKQKLWMQYKIN